MHNDTYRTFIANFVQVHVNVVTEKLINAFQSKINNLWINKSKAS